MELGNDNDSYQHAVAQFSTIEEGASYVQDDNVDDDGRPKRTGTLWTALAHIVTAVIGSGVLSLAWSMSKLGWVAGPIALVIFALITYFTSVLLADGYRIPSDPHQTEFTISKRNYTYMDAVRSNLGEMQTKFCAIAQYGSFVAISVGYTITASISMVAISRSNCFHRRGHEASCYVSSYPYIIIFGLVQVVLSQIPNFSKIWWLSILAAVMSFSYSGITIGLGVAEIADISDGGKHSHGSLEGSLSDGGSMNDVALILQALGNIAFSYSYAPILIEIQDTIRSPGELKTMKTANLVGVSTITVFYMLCGIVGYSAFGSEAPGNLLTGFGFYEPYWLVDIANAFVVIHLVAAFQVFVQPLYGFAEGCILDQYPKNLLVNKVYKGSVPLVRLHFDISVFRLVGRTTFVVFTTLVAMIFPFFNDILGIIGAVAFWPLTIYFPISMYISQSKIEKWSHKWCTLQAMTIVCLILSIAVLIGSLQSLIVDLRKYKPFH